MHGPRNQASIYFAKFWHRLHQFCTKIYTPLCYGETVRVDPSYALVVFSLKIGGRPKKKGRRWAFWRRLSPPLLSALEIVCVPLSSIRKRSDLPWRPRIVSRLYSTLGEQLCGFLLCQILHRMNTQYSDSTSQTYLAL